MTTISFYLCKSSRETSIGVNDYLGSICEYIGRLSHIVMFAIFIDVDMIQSVRYKLKGNYFGNYIEWKSLKEIALYA